MLLHRYSWVVRKRGAFTMITNLRWNDRAGFAARFSSAPLELRAFAIFSLATTLIGYGLPMLGPKAIWESIMPFTGWSPALGYSFSLYFIAALIFSERTERNRYPRKGMRWGIILLLACHIWAGYQAQATSVANDFGNPYLIVSPWRFLWTEVVPALWIGVLLNPRVTKFTEQFD